MFTLDLFRVPAERRANNRTESVVGQEFLLDRKFRLWSTILPTLRTVPEGVSPNDFSSTTQLGSSDNFMEAFEVAVSNYQEMYTNENWGTPDESGNLQASTSPFIIDPRLDPSFSQKIIVPSGSRIVFIGDIHSSFHSFVEIISQLVGMSILSDDLVLDPNYYIIFIGDIFDRGPYALDILNMIFLIKNKNFHNVLIGNGNHEDYNVLKKGGTGEEISTQLTTKQHRETIYTLTRFFPSAIFIEMDGKTIQCCHGGIEPGYNPNQFILSDFEFEFHGFDSLDGYSLVNEGLRWSDFDTSVSGIQKSSLRGGKTLVAGIGATNSYLESNNLVGIIRGHQDRSHFSILPRMSSIPEDFKKILVLNKETMYEPTREYPHVNVGGFQRFPFHNFFDDYSVVTTSTATWSKGTGFYSFLILKSSGDTVRDAQAMIRPEVEGAFKHMGSMKEFEFLKTFQIGQILKTKNKDKLDETLVFLRDNFRRFKVLFPIYEILSHSPFGIKKKGLLSIFKKR